MTLTCLSLELEVAIIVLLDFHLVMEPRQQFMSLNFIHCLEVIGGVGGTCVINGCASKNIFELGSSFGGELERMPEFISGICLFLGANLRR